MDLRDVDITATQTVVGDSQVHLPHALCTENVRGPGTIERVYAIENGNRGVLIGLSS